MMKGARLKVKSVLCARNCARNVKTTDGGNASAAETNSTVEAGFTVSEVLCPRAGGLAICWPPLGLSGYPANFGDEQFQ